ncbi:hypothetical protein NST28_15910 [Paenibacillus sp. FSL R10-2791]|uniref:hypothetical protein n=1 Tax=Paenibacillus sp. FSL R10-2791 TaxID=2954695 RepID=UPI0030F8668A
MKIIYIAMSIVITLLSSATGGFIQNVSASNSTVDKVSVTKKVKDPKASIRYYQKLINEAQEELFAIEGQEKRYPKSSKEDRTVLVGKLYY